MRIATSTARSAAMTRMLREPITWDVDFVIVVPAAILK
jgi:hypothetical protein